MKKIKFSLRRIRLNRTGYIYGKYGGYRGVGKPLYEYLSDCGEFSGELRASHREDAKEEIRQAFRGAATLPIVFYR